MTSVQTGISTKSAGYKIRVHADYLSELPDPPETFFATDEPLENDATRRTLVEAGVIQRVRNISQYEGEVPYNRNEYRVAEWAADRVDEIVANRETFCPCGHGGFVNHGSHFECAYEGCDQQFDREELDTGGSS